MYTIKQAARRAGVTVPLLRAWERRYGIVRPERTPAGYRLYDDEAIDRLHAMRRLIEDGRSASQAAREVIDGASRSDEPAPGAEAARSAGAGDLPSRSSTFDAGSDLSGRFVDAAAALDEARLDGVLDEMFARGTFERVVDGQVFPALRGVGDAWERGALSVAAEHAASHAVLRRLSAAFEAAARPDARRPVLVGLPPGGRHELGALAFATALRRRGLPVTYLGADVPVGAWAAAVRDTLARAIVLGLATARDRAPARQVVAATGSIAPGLVVAAGGAAAAAAGLPGPVIILSDGLTADSAALELILANRAE